MLEHRDDDRAALQGLFERRAPGDRDQAHHRRRRYRKGEPVAHAAGFEIDLVSYDNFWLLPALAGVRLVDSLVKRGVDDGLSVPPAPLNRALTALFASERHLIGRLPLPVGASLLMCARRPAP